MSSGYVISVDPQEMANRFSDPATDSEYDLDSLSAEDVAQFFLDLGSDYEEKIKPLLDKIPQREADYIELYHLKGKRQADIASIFSVTQAAVSYRLGRGVQRLQYLLSIPALVEEDMRRDLPLAFPSVIACVQCSASGVVDGEPCSVCKGNKAFLLDVEILIGMYQTTSQTTVAAKLCLTQGRVRHRFFTSVEVLNGIRESLPILEPYYQVFSKMAEKRFNILKEVRLPQWANRGVDECM